MSTQSPLQPPLIQAQTDPVQDVLAVVCVVDASLSLATEWSRVVTGYIFPMLKRLNEAYSAHQFRLALVTYGAADTRPNPLLSKRFFSPPNFVTKDLCEDPRKLGIGSAIGVRGLSALEGMVAALELFDILQSSLANASQKDNKALVSHILLVAASPPDSAQRPAWNTLQHLDSVSWNTLPLELLERNINLSLVTLRQIQQFQDVQSAASAPGSQSIPWFTVHAPHILTLSGFPPLTHVQTPKLNATKRPNESCRSPDIKRQKVSEKGSLTLSPHTPGGGAGAVGHRTPSAHVISATHSTQPSQPPSQTFQLSTIPVAPTFNPRKSPAVPAAHLPTNAPSTSAAPTQQPFPININTLLERLKGIEVEIKTLDAKVQNAQSTGNTAVVESCQKERSMKYQFAAQLKGIVIQQAKATRAAMVGSNTGVRVFGETPQPPPQAQALPLASNNMSEDTAATEEQKLTDHQALVHAMQARAGLGGFSTASPEVLAQMQKLINKTGIQTQPFSGSPKPRPVATAASAQPQASTSSGGSKQWEGSFTFTAIQGGQPKGLEVQVAVTQSTGDLHAETWPDRIFISISKEGVKDRAELQAWLRKHQHSAAIIQFQPQARNIEQKLNDMCHVMLTKIMSERQTFAIAAWQLPSGTMSNNMIVFPVGLALAGAVFPLTGLPDLPGTSTVDLAKLQPQSPPQSGPFTPEMLSRLQGLDPQQQRRFLQQLALQQQMRQRQQQQAGTSQQEAPAVVSVPGVGMQNMSPFSNAVNLPMNVFGPSGVSQRQASGGMHPSGTGTVNYEMMQSFMQRSADGSSRQ